MRCHVFSRLFCRSWSGWGGGGSVQSCVDAQFLSAKSVGGSPRSGQGRVGCTLGAAGGRRMSCVCVCVCVRVCV